MAAWSLRVKGGTVLVSSFAANGGGMSGGRLAIKRRWRRVRLRQSGCGESSVKRLCGEERWLLMR